MDVVDPCIEVFVTQVEWVAYFELSHLLLLLALLLGDNLLVSGLVWIGLRNERVGVEQVLDV